jgi:nitrogenase cofactor biosynthesis protein NifB
MHLPVAPACNISCNYCNRKFDCVNESRPGVASEVLSPQAAAEKYLRVKAALPSIQVVGIAGPGDALANFERTEETLLRIRAVDPDVVFCLSTNGLYLDQYAERLREIGVTHVTVTMNTIDAQIGAQIYREVVYEGHKYTGLEGAALLLEKQLSGLEQLKRLALVSKINTVLIRGINDGDIENVARKARDYGVYIGNVMQLIPASGSVFEHMPLTSNQELNEVRKRCEPYVKQMYHCQQCRADAIGLLGQDCSAEFRENQPAVATADSAEDPPKGTFTALVTTKDRRLINQHFGHADQFYIYRYEDGAIRLKDIRDVTKYCGSSAECGEEERNEGILAALQDCDFVLTQRIGYYPQQLLERHGKKIITTYGFISEELQKTASEFLRGK